MENNIENVSKYDPSSNGKYKKWLLRELEKGYKIQDIEGTLQFFHSNVIKFKERDIYKWDAKDLENHIKENSFKSNTQKRRASKKGSKKIYEDDRFVIVSLEDSKDAAIYYSKGTKWCIGMEDANYFETYRDDNVVFFILIDKAADNQSQWGKVAIVCYCDDKNRITNTEYYDSEDNSYGFGSLPEEIKNCKGLK